MLAPGKFIKRRSATAFVWRGELVCEKVRDRKKRIVWCGIWVDMMEFENDCVFSAEFA